MVVYEPYPEVELTEIVRQKGGNPIIDLSRNLAQMAKGEAQRNEIGGYIFSNDYNRVVATLAHVNGSDELKYLAYTNAEVDKVNRDVRKAIYGANPKKIELGETIVFNTPYGDYYTNEEIKVEEVIEREKEFDFIVLEGKYGQPNVYKKVKLKYYSINPGIESKEDFISDTSWGSISNKKEIKDNIIVIHEDSEKEFNEVTAYMRAKIKVREISWVKYYDFIEGFADMKYNHAITVHKS